MTSMLFRQLFDPRTSTYTYLLADEATREAILIDPVLEQVERDEALLDELGLTLAYTLETHVHADHVTGGGVLRVRRGSRYVVSRAGGTIGADVEVDDGDDIVFGHERLIVFATPGHTDGCVTYVTADRSAAFTGDAVLIRGCGRTDFQQGCARTLFLSVRDKIFGLADDAKIYPAHDYEGRTVSTVGEEKQHNPRLKMEIDQDAFVGIMNDLNLDRPKRIDVAMPANLRCGMSTQDWMPIARTSGDVPEVSTSSVARLPEGVHLIDVRSRDEYEGELGHIDGTELVPLPELSSAFGRWEKDSPYVVICRSGGRSGKAATAMEEAGFQRVASMAGGMLRWRAEEARRSRS